MTTEICQFKRYRNVIIHLDADGKKDHEQHFQFINEAKRESRKLQSQGHTPEHHQMGRGTLRVVSKMPK